MAKIKKCVRILLMKSTLTRIVLIKQAKHLNTNVRYHYK
jgi:hypothetical protein